MPGCPISQLQVLTIMPRAVLESISSVGNYLTIRSGCDVTWLLRTFFSLFLLILLVYVFLRLRIPEKDASPLLRFMPTLYSR